LSQAETIRDIAAILEKLSRGTEVVVEMDSRPVAIIGPPPPPERPVPECLALAKAHGSTATLDPEFSRDLEEIMRRRRQWGQERWD
jgi:hypothetical protein